MTGLLLSLAALWILLAAVWAALWPLFTGASDPPPEAEIERQDLEAEKARLLQEIHELELDYETGKLSDDDYRAIEGRLKGRAVEVMQRIDALAPKHGRSRVFRRPLQGVGSADDAIELSPSSPPRALPRASAPARPWGPGGAGMGIGAGLTIAEIVSPGASGSTSRIQSNRLPSSSCFRNSRKSSW